MWYSVSLFYEGVHSTGPREENLWEEEIILVSATDASDAQNRAAQIAKEQEHEYLSGAGDVIHWIFRQIGTVYQIETELLQDGVELFSRFLRATEASSLLSPLCGPERERSPQEK
jgi:hypothetical protein